MGHQGPPGRLPVYQLLGGKCREAADCYGHASGAEIPEVIDSAGEYMAQGFRHVRVQIGVPGMAGYGSRRWRPREQVDGAAQRSGVTSPPSTSAAR